eukprot:7092714-Prymnesium_polylepis.1
MIVLPYKRFDVNALAIASNLIITCGLLSALLIKLYDDFTFSWTAEDTARVLGYGSTADLAILMAILCFLFLTVVLFAMSRTTKSIDDLVKRRLAAVEEFKRVQDAFDELTPAARPPVAINDNDEPPTIGQPVA